jgi:outer membrane immunogenic protein
VQALSLHAIFTVLRGAGGAQAADGALATRKTAAPVLAYAWPGIYIGGHIGAGVSYRDWTLVDGRISEAGDAVLLGGQIGVNYQIGKWVFGAEGDASWGNLKNESLCPDGNNTLERENWLATVTGRLGYAFDPAPFYLKGGGAAFTHAEYFKTAQIPSVLDERAGRAKRLDLWAPEWNTRCGATGRSLEYDYLEFGSRSLALNIATGHLQKTLALQEKAQGVKFGLNYLFNANNWAPVVPQNNKRRSLSQARRLGGAARFLAVPVRRLAMEEASSSRARTSVGHHEVVVRWSQRAGPGRTAGSRSTAGAKWAPTPARQTSRSRRRATPSVPTGSSSISWCFASSACPTPRRAITSTGDST